MKIAKEKLKIKKLETIGSKKKRLMGLLKSEWTIAFCLFLFYVTHPQNFHLKSKQNPPMANNLCNGKSWVVTVVSLKENNKGGLRLRWFDKSLMIWLFVNSYRWQVWRTTEWLFAIKSSIIRLFVYSDCQHFLKTLQRRKKDFSIGSQSVTFHKKNLPFLHSIFHCNCGVTLQLCATWIVMSACWWY